MLVNDVKTVVQKIPIESKGQGKRVFPQLGILDRNGDLLQIVATQAFRTTSKVSGSSH